jgi:organic hydroperoxide reductase OsmC/OhrA
MLSAAARSLRRPLLQHTRVQARSYITLKDVKVRPFQASMTTRVPDDAAICLQYKVSATATGAGRNGEVESNGFDLDLATPKELGGTGKGTNPEQLFAMGYACQSFPSPLSIPAPCMWFKLDHDFLFVLTACFLGAAQLMARKQKKPDQVETAKVHVSVVLGEPEDLGGFGLGVDIQVEGVDEEVLQAAHEVRFTNSRDCESVTLRWLFLFFDQACPYSRALKLGVNVNVSKA